MKQAKPRVAIAFCNKNASKIAESKAAFAFGAISRVARRSRAEDVLRRALAFRLWHPHQQISRTVNFSVNQYRRRGLILPVVDPVGVGRVVGHSGQPSDCFG
jgi:hypothetical protein